MSDLSAALWFDGGEVSNQNLVELKKYLPAEKIYVCCDKGVKPPFGVSCVEGSSLAHGGVLRKLIESCRTKLLLLLLKPGFITFDSGVLNHVQSAFKNIKPSLLYSSYFIKSSAEESPGTLQPLIDYQEGSVRDDFDFGYLVFLDVERAKRSLALHKHNLSENFTGWYSLRLFLSLDALPYRLSAPLYSAIKPTKEDLEAEHFKYVEKSSLAGQKELEKTFTWFAKQAGFFLPSVTARTDLKKGYFPVEASVVIPVKNRATTIGDAIASAASQVTKFKYNIIVVNNYSDDGTTEKLEELTKKIPNLVTFVPSFASLGIGGCWNEAIFHPKAGRFCVQLDSDDLYSDKIVLQRIVDVFYEKEVGAVVGSYKLVDFSLKEIPPGKIDHREWSDDNGHNNALRVNGFGAPRAYYTPLARENRFPNVSYGEDYAMMLAISREHRIARIYDTLYHCRRWEGNSDASPSIEKLNAFNLYKDGLRTQEIKKRKELNKR